MVEQAMKVSSRQQMRPVIEKELLHYDILFALDQSDLLDQLTFQGGTSLRLCYGAERFSEDLDFAGGKDFSANQLIEMKTCLENYLGDRYGLEVSVKEPSALTDESDDTNICVSKWQLSITTAPSKKDMPKQRVKIVIVNIPAYSRQPLALQQNYDFLPDGYNDLLIFTENLDEIMADKLIAFVNCTRYIRYRDIWDLRWLKQKLAKPHSDYLLKKIKDYHVVDYAFKLEDRLASLPDLIKGKTFFNEMSRFIPVDILERTLLKDKFLDFLVNEITLLLNQVKQILV